MTQGVYYDMPFDMYPVHMFHPNFKTMDMWMPALDAWVLDSLCRKVNCDDFLEIGSFVGTSASILARHCRRLLCVDTWLGSGPDDPVTELYAHGNVFGTFMENVRGFPCQMTWFQRELNPDTLPEYLDRGDRKYDLIFIDGAHDYESVMADIRIAEEWVAPGGIICGHDFWLYQQVAEAAVTMGLTGVCGQVWWKEML